MKLLVFFGRLTENRRWTLRPPDATQSTVRVYRFDA